MTSTTDFDKIADAFADIADDMPANKYYERPATIALLPELRGLDVLDAGCGSGFYTELALKAGANVVAFDPSEEMVRHARQRVNGACDIFACTSAELLQRLEGRQFDLVLSNLVLHYVRDLNSEFSVLARMMKPDGRMIVSMKHPFRLDGFIKRHGYRASGWVRMDWAVPEVVHVQRPLGVITKAIADAGLYMETLLEALPRPEMAEHDPEGYGRASRHVPFFIHFVLRPRPRSAC